MDHCNHNVESLSLFDIPNDFYCKEFNEMDDDLGDKIKLEYNSNNSDDKLIHITMKLYKRLLYSPNKKIHLYLIEKDIIIQDQPTDIKNYTCIEKLKNINSIIIILCHGGYFSAAVFNGKNVVVHKTFHHYVSRKKQGGRQSTKDRTGNKPKSGGASIRRYNEQKHQSEIRKLFKNWKEHLSSADLIFTHIPGRNRNEFYLDDGKFDKNNCLVKSSKGLYYFHKDDERIRPLPFTTQRPTYSQVRNIFVKLTSIKVTTDISYNNNNSETEEILSLNSLRSSTDFVISLPGDEDDEQNDFEAPEESSEEEY